MFYIRQSSELQKKYRQNLQLIGSLSNLFSQSNIPYLYYRVAEKIFCDAFGTFDLSRGDVALDAYKDGQGIGLKTFLASNNRTLQKVAEFDKDKELYQNLSPKQLVIKVAKLRNTRINFAENLYDVKDSIYHCVVREEQKFKLYEEAMEQIDIANLSNVRKRKNSIFFDDGRHEYTFNLSKSTLLKRFVTKYCVDEFAISIVDDPLEVLRHCLKEQNSVQEENHIVDTIYLPLYGRDKKVFQSSGLNQWNAKGRLRDPNEVYIPIPAKIHQLKPNFFPSREEPFNLILPDKKVLQSKVCQANNKALMSYSNRELGKWILRDVLRLPEGELVTYEHLKTLGIDSVRIDKYQNGNYQINFASLDSYENFINSLEQ